MDSKWKGPYYELRRITFYAVGDRVTEVTNHDTCYYSTTFDVLEHSLPQLICDTHDGGVFEFQLTLRVMLVAATRGRERERARTCVYEHGWHAAIKDTLNLGVDAARSTADNDRGARQYDQLGDLQSRVFAGIAQEAYRMYRTRQALIGVPVHSALQPRVGDGKCLMTDDDDQILRGWMAHVSGTLGRFLAR